jgi:hypothetical protein
VPPCASCYSSDWSPPRADTRGKIEEIDAKYELLQRGQYERLYNPLSLKADKKLPLELYEARNAVQIARSIGADRFANETFVKAEKSLAAACDAERRLPGLTPWFLLGTRRGPWQVAPAAGFFIGMMIALAETVAEFAIPIDPFEALISAFEQDQTVTEYALLPGLLVSQPGESGRGRRESGTGRDRRHLCV